MTLYTPKETKVYEDMVALVARSTRARYNVETAVRVEIVLYTKKKKPPDCDNSTKSLLDGMVKGGLLEDDSQVWELNVKRVRSNNPRVNVRVNAITVEREGK